jgi:capsular polysaccharide biosynthesis protein
MNEQKYKDIVEINFRGFFKVIKKRKTAFIIAFCIILLVGLVYTFITAPEYSSVSQVSLSNSAFYYSSEFYKYLPEEADSLLIIPDYDKDKGFFYISDKLDTFSEDIKSAEVLENVSNRLGGKVTEKEVAESINIVLDRWSGKIIFTTFYDDPEVAYQLNYSLLDEYIDLKNAELLENYNQVIVRINDEIEETEQSLKLLLAGIESNEGIDLTLDTAIEEETEKLAALNIIEENLVDSKDYFTNRIEILESPDINDVRNTSNYFRNILLSIIAAILAGIISAFVVNYFKTPGKKS